MSKHSALNTFGRSGNPAFTRNFENAETFSQTERMTLDGAVNKTAILLALCFAGAFAGWNVPVRDVSDEVLLLREGKQLAPHHPLGLRSGQPVGLECVDEPLFTTRGIKPVDPSAEQALGTGTLPGALEPAEDHFDVAPVAIQGSGFLCPTHDVGPRVLPVVSHGRDLPRRPGIADTD